MCSSRRRPPRASRDPACPRPARYGVLWAACLLRARSSGRADALWSIVSSSRRPLSRPAAALAPIVSSPTAWWTSTAAAAGCWWIWSVLPRRLGVAATCGRRPACARTSRTCPATSWIAPSATGLVSAPPVVRPACCSRRGARGAVLGAAHRYRARAGAARQRLGAAISIACSFTSGRMCSAAMTISRSSCNGSFALVVGWHPAAWWLERQLEFEREAACDEIAVSVTGSAKEYATCLATLAALPALEPATGGRACGRVSAPPSCADCAHSDGAVASPRRVPGASSPSVAASHCWRARWSSPTCSSRRLRHHPRSLHQLRVAAPGTGRPRAAGGSPIR